MCGQPELKQLSGALRQMSNNDIKSLEKLNDPQYRSDMAKKIKAGSGGLG